ncbi:M6 family metalloprotease domain-containing protein [Geodermatophilus obscurus]|uniref:M6 family metalloprotease domain-containing protein n=1 Tax=Geodermatophilus obscurus TaxID=1861 RepID=A0A1I5CN40_9ACTN|nr:M6 family metalloprotease domain-containing protein [Geodermatophilus obscurus]SFN88430.1 M6 family metalloprotease domain-containing protein [Geodermatophilus obscurus]
MSGIFGETLTFTQEGGAPLRLVTFGDERYSRTETPEGFTVLYDDGPGLFCYADRTADGALFSTGVPVEAAPPDHVPRHVQDAADRRRAWIRARTEWMLPPPGPHQLPVDPEALLTFGPDGGLLRGRRLDAGDVRGLTVLVRFPDLDTTVGEGEVDQLLNGEDFRGHGNACSVSEYFRTVSSGRLHYTNTVVGPFTLSRPRLAYASETHRGLLVPEAIELALRSGVDLSDFDSLGEGIVDALSIMYAGRTEYRGDLWPHNWVHEVHQGSTRTQLYTVTSTGRRPADLSIGTFCHEAGHMLMRWPDLYDYGRAEREGDSFESAGIGSYCVMGSGNHLDVGRTPAPVSVYLRDLSGWCGNEVVLEPGRRHQAQQGDFDTVLRHRTTRDHEYFLVENRSRAGFDTHLPSSGLAVYHCDTRGSNEFQQGTAAQHYQCALLQADGRHDLEAGADSGDGEDLYGRVAGTALSHATRPHSRTWDGADSGLTISDIDPPGPVIGFTVGPVDAPTDVVTAESAPRLAIPDDRPAGVSDVLHLDAAGTVRSLVVSVDVTHPSAGDLRVHLTSPAGRRAVLHDGGGDSHDLHLRLGSAPPSPLQVLTGQPVTGDWVLSVSDVAARDAGRLDRWRLELTPGS